ncbi:uncharacterized protein F5891DRAFT_1146589 [Suillus fuscotomentosus]|uniref:CCHC-type domain-containing protein n=1 Tax=Suillus fuscotomentosus TaxID=1912939 RepID=A0AAD4E5S2_9AGAM|nr:uncharacterized protein F5891DRAFT_1146589 [Suillus fuscotomentosus]KAG1899867.1 hypothetical protein F5891DRAFT_1146589 [Suillus fuscotomentosus]
MAARLPQLARLILFTGPNCSLCDVAKLELAKVRQSYQFDLEIVNIQDKGQERWKKKYVYWIPALHLDGREIAKGRWDASTVLESMRQWNAALEAQEESSPYRSNVACNFYIDTSGSAGFQELSPQLCFYDRHVSGILGENRSPSPTFLDVRFCFNCGSPDHIIGSCPEPHNRPLIALSRQLFNFLRSDGETREPGRFHVVEAWKKQRLEWLEFFQPGKVVGPALREALGLQHGDSGHQCAWLCNMSYWGYPTGWISDTDPRDAVRQRILGDFDTLIHGHPLEGADDSFLVISGEEDHEVIDLSLATSFYIKSGEDETPVVDDTLSASSDSGLRSLTPRRWATYPDDYFSSDHLTVYNGTTLQIISGTQSANVLVPPWRLPGAFSSLQSHIECQPPPPPSTPPPLPPSPPSLPPPPVHPQYCALITATEDDSNDSDMDMDLSDNE